MRRHLVICALVLAACAKSEQPAADTTAATPAPPPTPPPISLADVAGVWESKVMPVDRDTVVTTAELTATSTMTGWKQKLPNGVNADVRVVSVAGDSIVTESGPFKSVLRKGQMVSTHQISRLRDGQMQGVIHAKYKNGDTATLRFVATKKPAVP
jgi:predicted lipoprotein